MPDAFLHFHIQKKLGDFHLNLQAEFPHDICGIFGPTGAGKTTLLNCMAGFVSPDAGEIRLGERILYSLTQGINVKIEKRRIGMVFQDALLFPHLTVKQNILYGIISKKDMARFDFLVDLLKLQSLLKRKPQTLSAGEGQKVALARALVREPEIFLMDEPVSSVDLESRYQILGFLKQIYQNLSIPIVYVSHAISELLFLTHWVLVMERGQRSNLGDPYQVILNPDHFPKGIPEEVSNIYELPVLEIKRENGVAVVDFDGFPLVVSYSASEIKPFLRIMISARDILVSTAPIQRISARNILPGTLVERKDFGLNILLYVKIQKQICLVEITRSASEDLQLKKQQTIYLVLKAHSINVLNPKNNGV